MNPTFLPKSALMRYFFTFLVLTLWLIAPFTKAGITLDFEGYADSTALTNQYAPQGVMFSNSTIIKSGLSLNEFEFPPFSGENAIFNDGGFVTGLFSTAVSDLSIRVTYTSPVTLVAFDAAHLQIGSVTSLFPENFVSSGNPSNELLTLSVPSGISSFELQGAVGGSVVADDLVFNVVAIPEPSSVLFGLVVALVSIRSHFGGGRCRAMHKR